MVVVTAAAAAAAARVVEVAGLVDREGWAEKVACKVDRAVGKEEGSHRNRA